MQVAARFATLRLLVGAYLFAAYLFAAYLFAAYVSLLIFCRLFGARRSHRTEKLVA